MKTKQWLIALCVAAGAAAPVYAGSVNVTWSEPQKYIDVRASNESQKRFEAHVFKELDKHWQKMAAELPEEINLTINVTNLNLAGDVDYSFGLHRDVRVIKSLYWPMIEFDYQITAHGEVVSKGTAKIKDMAFMDRATALRSNRSSFYYEKRVISDWFEDEVETLIASWQQKQDAVMGE
jgi:hypothetical protein